MVSDNLEDIGDVFGDMVEDRDVMGIVALAGVGSIGGVLVEMVQDEFAQQSGMFTADPSDAKGLGISFLVKGLLAMAIGAIALSAGGSIGVAGTVLGIGAAINAGDDFVQMVDQFTSGSTSSSARRSSRRTRSRPTRTRTSPSRSRSRSRSSSSTSSRNLDRPGAEDPYGSLLA